MGLPIRKEIEKIKKESIGICSYILDDIYKFQSKKGREVVEGCFLFGYFFFFFFFLFSISF